MRAADLAYYLSLRTEEEVTAIALRARQLRNAPVDEPSLAPSEWSWLTECAAVIAGIPTSVLIGRGRALQLVAVRAAVVVVLRDVCEASWPAIGRAIGRDHTTAMNAYERAQDNTYEPTLGAIRGRLVAEVLRRVS
tara:strand:- start:1116 stop:1523 length:408 start_codon:yes stop_codon:yes gene_type:complete